MIDTMLIGSINDETIYTASLSAINVTARVMLFISAIARGMLVIVIAQYAQNIRDVYAGGLRGSGDTKYIAKYTILTDVFLKVILSYICVLYGKISLRWTYG